MSTEELKLEIRPLWDVRFPHDNNGIYEVVHITKDRVRLLYLGDIYECNSFIHDSKKVNPLDSSIEDWLDDIAKKRPY